MEKICKNCAFWDNDEAESERAFTCEYSELEPADVDPDVRCACPAVEQFTYGGISSREKFGCRFWVAKPEKKVESNGTNNFEEWTDEQHQSILQGTLIYLNDLSKMENQIPFENFKKVILSSSVIRDKLSME